MMAPTNTKETRMARGASIIALLAGLWFFISPWVYGVEGMHNAWNSWIVGAVIVILAAIRIGSPENTASLSWVNCFLGVWTFISPWIYAYTPQHGRFINSLCVGVIVFIASIASADRTEHAHPPMATRT